MSDEPEVTFTNVMVTNSDKAVHVWGIKEVTFERCHLVCSDDLLPKLVFHEEEYSEDNQKNADSGIEYFVGPVGWTRTLTDSIDATT